MSINGIATRLIAKYGAFGAQLRAEAMKRRHVWRCLPDYEVRVIPGHESLWMVWDTVKTVILARSQVS